MIVRYSVLITRRAEKDILALDAGLKARIRRALLELDPLGKAKKLANVQSGQYRVRVGDWRIVFDLSGRQVTVLRVGHR